MCGLTLLPRKVRPRIFLVAMSMTAMSFESRSTMTTTLVMSGTLTLAPVAGGGITIPGILGMFGIAGMGAGAAKLAEDRMNPLTLKLRIAESMVVFLIFLTP